MNGSPGTKLMLVLGPANSGKLGLVLEWWVGRLSQRPLLVAPTAPDAQQLSLELARRYGGLVGQSPALTFDGLVRLLLGRCPRYASDFERALITARLLRSTPLDALSAGAQLPGVSEALGALLEQLAESGKDLDALERVLARWASVSPESSALAGDLRRLIRAKEGMYASLGLTDRPSAAREAAAAAEDWSRPVAFYGFSSFTWGQRALIEQLFSRVEVLVTFSHDSSRAVNLTSKAEIGWWESRAAHVERVATDLRAYRSPALAYLDRQFMSLLSPRQIVAAAGPGGEGDNRVREDGQVSNGKRSWAENGASHDNGAPHDNGVRFLLSSGRQAEAELAAEQIAGLIRSGVRPGEIAVVVRHMRQWSALLGHVFDSCGIPYQMDDRCSLQETGLGHAFRSALKGALFDDGEAALTYLRTPYSGLSADEVADLESRYRRGPRRGASALTRLAAGMSLPSVQEVWEIVQQGNGPLGSGARFLDLVRAEALARHMLAAGLSGALCGEPTMEQDIRAFRTIRAALAAMDSMKLMDAPSETEGLGSAPTGLGLAGLDAEVVLRALGRARVPGGGMGSSDAVQILTVQRARALRFDVVMVLGLVEGEFPGRPDRPALLNVEQRVALEQVAEELLPPEAEQEAALFASALSRSWRLLFLSARDAEDDGSESAPSHYWQEVRALLGSRPSECISRTLADQVFSPDTAPSVRHYLRGCAAFGRAPHPSVAPSGISSLISRSRRRSFQLTAPIVLRELEATECFSPSALETYAQCPFRWFGERVVQAEALEPELDDRAIGQLLHTALSTTYQQLAAEGLLPLRREGLIQAQRTAYMIIDDLAEEECCPGTVAERRFVAGRLKQMARNLFEMEALGASELTLLETEMPVGGSQGVNVGGIRIQGRVDRVDVSRDGQRLFVIDYKSSSIPPVGSLGTDAGLQLPLYLMALAAERPEADVIGGAYLSLSQRKRSGVVAQGSECFLGSGAQGCRVLDEEARTALFEAALEVAQQAAKGIQAGVIAPHSDGPCPSWCSLGQLCRVRRGGYRL